MSDRYLLLGTDDGLSVLDLLPGLHGGASQTSGGGHPVGLGDAKPRKLWIGESIHQLALLEVAQTESRDASNMKGVVLALVGVDTGEERRRTVRMYSLSSLCSLISFAVNQPVSQTLPLVSARNTDSLIFVSGLGKASESRYIRDTAGTSQENT